MTRLADLARVTGLPVDPHLVLDVVIPVHEGIQAQGDLLVVPLAQLAGWVSAANGAQWREVPPTGVELLRGGAGGNPHSLVADPNTCLWTPQVSDVDGLGIALVDAMAPVYLLHREHGGTGIAPGRYVVRRQRELAHPTPLSDQPGQDRRDTRQQRREVTRARRRAERRIRLVAD